MFLMDATIISAPTTIIISAIIIVVNRSIVVRYFISLWWAANFSLTMMRNPETESVRLWIASEAIARELDSNPMMILKIASKKLTIINK